jgi:hypothetical protein
MTPRQAFAVFEELERRFGLDDSPLLVLLRTLVEAMERLEREVLERKGRAS